MVKDSRDSRSTYHLWLEPEVHKFRNSLPGNIRNRIRRTIEQLSRTPRNRSNLLLDTTGLDLPPSIEIRRVRLERWRIIYAVNEAEKWVWVLAIHKRPPYDYEDLPEITSKLKG